MSGAPFEQLRAVVEPGWIDGNGHMNMGYYLVVFDQATDAWFDHIGLDEAHRRRAGVAAFTLEAHVNYLRELREGAPLRFTTQLLDCDEKRIHYFHRMYHAQEGFLAATNELISLHVSLLTRSAEPIDAQVRARLEAIRKEHARLALPEQAGSRIGIPRRSR
jgi:acyl-CoA thioester hydrolase